MLSVSKPAPGFPLNPGAGSRTAKTQASSLEIQDQLETSKAGILFTSPDALRPGRADWWGTSRRPSGRAVLGSVIGVSVSSWTRTITSRDARWLFSSTIRPVVMVAMTAGLELLGPYALHFNGVDIDTLATRSRKASGCSLRLNDALCARSGWPVHPPH